MQVRHIWGTAPSDVYACGLIGYHEEGKTDSWRGFVLHYDGTQWSQNYIYYVEGAYDVQVRHIWGTAPSDVYACGLIGYHEEGKTDSWRGFVLHYDGYSWKEVVQAQFNSQFLKVRKNQNSIIVQSFSYEIGAVDVIGFYRVKDNALEKLHSTNLDTVYWASLHVINNKTYFVIGPDVYEYLATGKMVERLSFPQPEFRCQIYGRTAADLFIAMKDGIAHYNGVDTQYLYKYPVTYMSGINDPMIFDREVFFCIDNPLGSLKTRNMMLHGILNEEGD